MQNTYPRAFEVLRGGRFDRKRRWCNPFSPRQLWQGASQLNRRKVDNGYVNCKGLTYKIYTNKQIKSSSVYTNDTYCDLPRNGAVSCPVLDDILIPPTRRLWVLLFNAIAVTPFQLVHGQCSVPLYIAAKTKLCILAKYLVTTITWLYPYYEISASYHVW